MITANSVGTTQTKTLETRLGKLKVMLPYARLKRARAIQAEIDLITTEIDRRKNG